MLNKILEHSTNDELREFLKDAFTMIKNTDYHLYCSLKDSLYERKYGKHFTEWLLDVVSKDFINEDGTKGFHWSLSDTTDVAKNYGIVFKNFNECDWNYVMNMIYSDYYGAIPDTLESYVKVARKFIEDKDAPNNKAYIYYKSMR